MTQKFGLAWIFFSISILNNFTLVLSQISPFTFLATSCETYPRFANGSQYEANLKTLLHNLSSNATTPNGYHQAICGNGNDNTVYGHFLCRGDQNGSACQDCINEAINKKLPEICPNRKFAVIWYDECMIKYSYYQFFGVLDLEWVINYNSSIPIPGNKSRFLELRNNMMINRLAERASNGGSKKFATDYQNITIDSQKNITLYGLEQCTPDLSEGDCKTCLLDAINKFYDCDGGRVFYFSCIARYEVKPFFDLSTVRSWPSPPPSLMPSHSGKKMSIKVILAVVIPVIVILMALLVLGICRVKHKKLKTYDAVTENGDEDFTNVESLQYDLVTLQTATLNFSNEQKLGEGGFGSVYKGTLSDGQEVAVKRLSKMSTQGVQQFKNEVLLVAKLQHRNLVRLLGFCLEGQEKLLIYEYVPNKSLDNFLFEAHSHELLSWGTRYKLIEGIARGMLYIHHDSQLRIIHRDLKAGNVLLDADMSPKISDFGTARIFGVDQSQCNTSRIVGTYGYMSPEYAMHGQFSIKSDVYSFGVLVLEIISGKRNTTFYQSGVAEDLLSYAWRQWRDGMLLEFVDPVIRDSCSTDELVRCIHLGLLCVQESAEDRPTMATIVLTLDSYSITLPVPEAPGFFIKSRMESEVTKEVAGSNQSSTKSTHLSMNDISVTEPEPR